MVKKHVYREGDWVRLIHPRKVVKVGYDVDTDSILDDMLKEAGSLYHRRLEPRSQLDRFSSILAVWRQHPVFREVRAKLIELTPNYGGKYWRRKK